MLVVDCPSESFLPSLTSAPLLQECSTGAKRDRGAWQRVLGTWLRWEMEAVPAWLVALQLAVATPLVNSALPSSGAPFLLFVSAAATVVHLSPLEVLRLPAYQAWLASFAPAAQHILVAESIGSPAPVMRKSAIVQVRVLGRGASPGWRAVPVAQCLASNRRLVGPLNMLRASCIPPACAAAPLNNLHHRDAAGQAEPD